MRDLVKQKQPTVHEKFQDLGTIVKEVIAVPNEPKILKE
jgi:hypothetical protein